MADEAERIQSIDAIAKRQDGIDAKLDQLLAGGSKPAAGDGAAPQGRPPSVEEQVRAELARAEQERTDQAAASAKEQEHQTMAERLRKLEESPPLQPLRRITKAMWGNR
jgi:hypothetical protein